MTPSNPDTISRLRAANPVRVEVERGKGPMARATLERILAGSRAPATPRRRRINPRLPRGGLAVALALGLAGGGAAFAATNPFGWWSSNPDQARYALNPSGHARTPTAYVIGCQVDGTRFVCSPARFDPLGRPYARGQLYTKFDTIHQPNPAGLFTRAHFLKAITQLEATRKLTAIDAARLRHDMARVPDSFFTEMRLASRYGTYGSGGPGQRVPPAGVPEFLVCEQIASRLSCQNLNGDERAPIGAGVYGAQPAADWRPPPPQRPEYGLPPGIRFTRAEYQLLIDLARYGGTTSSGGGRVHTRPIQHS